MGYVNKVILIGNLGQDPETRYLPSGEAVTNISLATTETWKDKQTGEKKERTEWHRASIFGPRAEVLAKYCSKGDPLYVEGSLQTRKWQDNDGNDRWSTEIKIREFQFIGARRSGQDEDEDQSRSAPRDAESQVPDKQQDFDDDIPF